MRYAIISDIHSDYNSLQNVLSNIEKQEIDKIIFIEILCALFVFMTYIFNYFMIFIISFYITKIFQKIFIIF